MGLAAIGVLTMIPGFVDVASANSGEEGGHIAPWAFWTMFIGAMQLLYVVYLVQVPDWSSVWVVSILNLIITTFYATMMAILLMGKGENAIAEALQLTEMHGADIRKKALIWCISMLSISSLLTYLSGRVGIRWHKTYKMTVAATEGTASE